jgi:phenylalanyl-tRNA synthetase beta chain
LFFPPLGERTTGRSQAARPQLESDLGMIPEQRPAFAAILAGPRPAYLERPETDVYDAKGLALELVERVTQREAEVRLITAPDEARHLHPRGRAEVVVAGQRVGWLGPVHPDVVDALDLDGPAFVVEIDLVALERAEYRTPRYRPIPRLPAVSRDVSLEVGEELLAGELAGVIRDAAGELCESVELIDRFTGKSLPPAASSLTYRLTYRDPKAATDPDRARTLTDKEVDRCQSRVHAATEKLGAKLRGG